MDAIPSQNQPEPNNLVLITIKYNASPRSKRVLATIRTKPFEYTVTAKISYANYSRICALAGAKVEQSIETKRYYGKQHSK